VVQEMGVFRGSAVGHVCHKIPTAHKITAWIEALLGVCLSTVVAPAPAAGEDDAEAEAEPEEAPEATEDPLDAARRKAQEELEEAQARLKEAAELLLTMRSKIAELKTYKVEPKHVEVLHAAFVLLGSRLKDVQSWAELRKRLGPEFFEQVTSFQANDISKKLLRRAVQSRKLLDGLSADEVRGASDALAGIFSWVSSAADSLERAAALAVATQRAEQATEEGPAAVDLDRGNMGGSSAAADLDRGSTTQELGEVQDSDSDDDVLDEATQKLVDALVAHHEQLVDKELQGLLHSQIDPLNKLLQPEY